MLLLTRPMTYKSWAESPLRSGPNAMPAGCSRIALFRHERTEVALLLDGSVADGDRNRRHVAAFELFHAQPRALGPPCAVTSRSVTSSGVPSHQALRVPRPPGKERAHGLLHCKVCGPVG